MDEAMLKFYPDGIRVLLVDDDPKFLKSASTLLSLLNFKVATCGSPISALRLLTGGNLQGIHVVLMDAEKAATCGFDFKAIVEPDLRIPVIYIISPDDAGTGDEAEELLHTLQAATYIIKKPLDADELSSLWCVIAWRKCVLDARRVLSTAGVDGSSIQATVVEGSGSGSAEKPLVSCSDDQRDEEKRVHFKVVKSSRKSRKRRASNPGGSNSGSDSSLGSSAGSGNHTSKAPETNAKGLEKDHAASQLQRYGAKKAKNGGGASSKSQRHPQAMHADVLASQHESRFVQAVLPAIHVPPYNPKIFADVAGLSSSNTSTMAPAPAPAPQQLIAGNVFSFSNVATFASGSNAAAAAPSPAWPASVYHQQQQGVGNVSGNNTAFPTCNNAVCQPQQYAGGNVNSNMISFAGGNSHAPAPAPAPPPPTYQHQQQGPARNVFSTAFPACNNSAGAALHPAYYQQQQQSAVGNVAPPAATRTTTATAVADDHQLRLSLARQKLTFGAFPYQGPAPPPAMHQAMCAPPIPRPVTGNIQPPFQQRPAGDDMGMASVATMEAAAATPRAGAFGGSTAGTYLTPTPSLNHGAAHDSDNLAAMAAMYTMPDAAPVAPNNVGLVVNQAAMAALYHEDSVGSLTVPQGRGMATNMNDLAMAALGNISGSLVGAGAATDGVANITAMVASSENEDISFPLGELLGPDASMYGASIDGQQGGATDGGCNVAPTAAATRTTMGNVAPLAATRRAMANAAPPAETMTAVAIPITDDHQLMLSLGRQQLTFGPFPYQGQAPPPAMHKAMCALPMPQPVTGNIQPPIQQPPTGNDLYIGMASVATMGASAATSRAGAFGGSTAGYLTPTPSLNHGAAHDSDDLAAMAVMYIMPDAAPVAPNNIGLVANQAAMAALYHDDNVGSLAVPQGLGMATNMNDLAMAALGNISGSLVGAGAATDGVGNFTAMVASTENEDISFPLGELQGPDASTYGASIDGQQGGATDCGGTTAAARNAAGILLNGGDGGMGSWDMTAPDGLVENLDDIFVECPDLSCC